MSMIESVERRHPKSLSWGVGSLLRVMRRSNAAHRFRNRTSVAENVRNHVAVHSDTSSSVGVIWCAVADDGATGFFVLSDQSVGFAQWSRDGRLILTPVLAGDVTDVNVQPGGLTLDIRFSKTAKRNRCVHFDDEGAARYTAHILDTLGRR